MSIAPVATAPARKRLSKQERIAQHAERSRRVFGARVVFDSPKVSGASVKRAVRGMIERTWATIPHVHALTDQSIRVAFLGDRAFTHHTWEYRRGEKIKVRGVITLPAIGEDSFVPRSVADSYVAYALHEAGHWLFTNPVAWGCIATMATRLHVSVDLCHGIVNALEDKRMEARFITAGYAAGFGALVSTLLGAIAEEAKSEGVLNDLRAGDLRQLPFALAYGLRGYVPGGAEIVAALPADLRAVYDYAEAAIAPLCAETSNASVFSGTADTMAIAEEVIKRLQAIYTDATPRAPKQPPQGEPQPSDSDNRGRARSDDGTADYESDDTDEDGDEDEDQDERDANEDEDEDEDSDAQRGDDTEPDERRADALQDEWNKPQAQPQRAEDGDSDAEGDTMSSNRPGTGEDSDADDSDAGADGEDSDAQPAGMPEDSDSDSGDATDASGYVPPEQRTAGDESDETLPSVQPHADEDDAPAVRPAGELRARDVRPTEPAPMLPPERCADATDSVSEPVLTNYGRPAEHEILEGERFARESLARVVGSPVLRTDLRRLFTRTDSDSYETGKRSGRLNVGALARAATGAESIFGRRTHLDGMDSAVSICIDLSSSMWAYDYSGTSGEGEQNITTAGRVASVLAGMFAQCVGVRTEIVGFRDASSKADTDDMLARAAGDAYRDALCPDDVGEYDMSAHDNFSATFNVGRCRLNVFKTFAEPVGYAHARLSQIRAGGSTPDFEAIVSAGRRLLKAQAARRILIMVTDGQGAPAETMKRAIDTLARRGVVCIGLGIGSDCNAAYAYRQTVRNASELGSAAMRALLRTVERDALLGAAAR